jgi:hypothetical protein
MKLRGDSGAVPARSGGGISGGGGRNVNPVYREVGSSVKVVSPKQDVKVKNIAEDLRVKNAKQGVSALGGARVINRRNDLAKAGGKTTKVIKINSNNL